MWHFNFSKPLIPLLPVAILFWCWKFNIAFKSCRIQIVTQYCNELEVGWHQEREKLTRARGDVSSSCAGYWFAPWSTSPAGTAWGALWGSPQLREVCGHTAAHGGAPRFLAVKPCSLTWHQGLVAFFWDGVTPCLNVVLAEMHLFNLVCLQSPRQVDVKSYWAPAWVPYTGFLGEEEQGKYLSSVFLLLAIPCLCLVFKRTKPSFSEGFLG